MKINTINIRNLVTFKFAQITELTMTLTDMIQLILGTNGSGKSNLLRQLSPLPPIRPDYYDGGGKRMELEHQGKTYVLVSDFSRKEGPHEFWCDGKNLNEGGTTDVQKELVISHLGWTPEVEALCFNALNFSGMSSGQREMLFTKLNPHKIDFILEHSKKAKSRIRACKTVIARLMERKVLLESKLMPDDTIKLMRSERDLLQSQSTELSKFLVRTETQKKSLESQLNPRGFHTEYDSDTDVLGTTRTAIKDLRSRWEQWSSVSRNHPEKQLEKTLNQIGQYQSSIEHCNRDIEDLQSSLRKGQSSLADMVGEDVITLLKSEIVSLHKTIAELEKAVGDCVPFPHTVVTERQTIMRHLKPIVDTFMDGPDRLYPRKKIALKQTHVSHWRSYYQEIERLVRNTHGKIRHLETSLKLKLDDIPDSPCAKSACPLYANFKSSYDTTQSQIKSERAFLSSCLAKQTRVQKYLDPQYKQLDALAPYNQTLNTLYEVISTYPSLQPFFRDPNTLAILARNPYSIYHKIEAHFEKSEAAEKLPGLREKVLKAEVELSKHQSISGNEKASLTKQIQDIEKQIKKKESVIQDNHTRLAQCRLEETYIRDYIRYRDQFNEFPKMIDDMVHEKSVIKECRKLDLLDRDLRQEYNRLNDRLTDIQSTLREQDILQSRYTNEIIAVIEDTEEEKRKLEVLNEAFESIPQSYTSQYLNSLIRSVNAFIMKVFTYELAILPICADKAVTYRFPYKAGGTEGPDISKCSTAQSEIINLALTLACRQALGLNDYPLFLDEVGKTFDPTHQQKLLDLFLFICDEHFASQLFIVNHHAVIHGGLMNTETLVLSDTNIMKTENYNQHVEMETY